MLLDKSALLIINVLKASFASNVAISFPLLSCKLIFEPLAIFEFNANDLFKEESKIEESEVKLIFGFEKRRFFQMRLVPLGDKVVLKQLLAEETTKSGIVLPGQAKEKPQQAEVIAVGPGGVVDGKEVTMQVKVGDKVIYSKYAGTDVKLGDEEFIVVKQNDIVAIVEE